MIGTLDELMRGVGGYEKQEGVIGKRDEWRKMMNSCSPLNTRDRTLPLASDVAARLPHLRSRSSTSLYYGKFPLVTLVWQEGLLYISCTFPVHFL